VLRQQLGRVALNPILSMDPVALKASTSSTLVEQAGAEDVHGDGSRGPGGHRVAVQPRGMSMEGDLTLATPPAMGTSFAADSTGFLHRGGGVASGAHLPRPKMDFPVFEGERPKTWKRQCESYFRVFSISPEHWVDTATMHFVGGRRYGWRIVE
jgi:hypothetical protein